MSQHTLHEAMRLVLLQQPGRAASTESLSSEIARQGLYRQRGGGIAPKSQIYLRARNYPQFFELDNSQTVRLVGSTMQDSIEPAPAAKRQLTPQRYSPKQDRDEDYVIDICDKVLNAKAKRQHRFSFLLGDPGRNGVCIPLPVDAFYEELNLVVEYRERQHTETVPFFDRRETVSGCGRGEQRRRYDQRRRDVLSKRGIRLVEIEYAELGHGRNKRLLRTRTADEAAISRKINPRLPNAL